MPRFKVTVEAKGPVFDGRAAEVVHEVVQAATRELAERGQHFIQMQANAMDRSGRGGTGRAAAGVILYDQGMNQLIFGAMVEGEVWWPWLEGTSKRNRSTKFGGYHTFRKARYQIAASADQVLEEKLAERIGEIGGRAG